MNKRFFFFLAYGLLAIASISSCQKPAEIDQEYVTHVITTLASDEMEGRKMFTPGIDKAAKFIAGEFEKIGLEHLDGLNGYQQKFDMYSISPESISVSLDGTAVDADKIIVSASTEGLDWTDVSALNVVSIKADENFQSAFNQARSGKGKSLLLIDPAHEAIFNRYKGFLSRGSQVMKMDDSNAFVGVITTKTSVKSVDVKVKNKVTTQSLANVAGKISGKRSNEIILFSGHYDHLGVRGEEGDTIYNGANDDASGTTAVIALAKYFKESGITPERTIMFVAFTAEEGGGYGSKYFSEQLNPDQIVAMFNIEMIGKGAKEGPNTAWITGFDKSNFGELLQKAVEGTEYTFYPDPYPTQNLFYRSDNATLARLGVPAHTISTTQIDIDKDYHQASDEVSTLDLTHMTNTIKAIAKAAEHMISGEDTPTRVDKASVR